ncbi:UbiA family prenyltransferase [Candidatus Riflebacteria bacterium]
MTEPENNNEEKEPGQTEESGELQEALSAEQLAEAAEITKNDDELRKKTYPARLWLYMRQRFKPEENIPLVLFLFFSQYLLFSHLLGIASKAELFTLKNLLIGLAVLGFFFNLRVYDEFKDLEQDRINFPERIVVRGIFTLEELKILGILTFIYELVISLYVGKELFFMFLIVALYSFLMAKEFFCGEWLEPKLLLYAASHMVIIPLIAIYCAVSVSPQVFEKIQYLLSVMFTFFFFVFSLEAGRKIRTPEDERPNYTTYSKIMGMKGALIFVFVLQALAFLCYIPVFLLKNSSGAMMYGTGSFCLLGFSYLFTIFLGVKVLLNPTVKGARNLEKTCPLPFILFLLTTIWNFWPVV